MNLVRFGQVIVRFKFLLAFGFLLAVVLAGLSIMRLTSDGPVPSLAYRMDEDWQSTATLFVTREGFPEGRSVLEEVVPGSEETESGHVPLYAGPDWYQTLAQLYAEFAMSDDVRAIMLRDGPIEGEYEVAPISSRDGSTFLPLVGIAGRGSSPREAEALAHRVMDAFLLYLRNRQQRVAIPGEERIEVQVLERPQKAELIQGRSLTRPIFLFVLTMSAFLGFAFALENLRPRPSPELRVEPTPVARATRKTA